MPARVGAKSLTISLADELSPQLTMLASKAEYGGSRSAVLEAALTQMLEVGANESVFLSLKADLMAAIQGQQEQLTTLSRYQNTLAQKQADLDAKLTEMARMVSKATAEMSKGFDRIARQVAQSVNQRPSLWKRLMG